MDSHCAFIRLGNVFLNDVGKISKLFDMYQVIKHGANRVRLAFLPTF
ncbi:hypothetical protein FLA_0198 [Filimonas lacunae]|nr:hypothetical protein FLA_0198 [Filimonas lacunae]